jgi:hypothetical protein
MTTESPRSIIRRANDIACRAAQSTRPADREHYLRCARGLYAQAGLRGMVAWCDRFLPPAPIDMEAA